MVLLVGRFLKEDNEAERPVAGRGRKSRKVMHMRIGAWVVVFMLSAGQPAWTTRPEIVLADFEGKDYAGWQMTGEAFGRGPAHGTLPRQMPVTGFLGKGLVNSFFDGDPSEGALLSPEFTINRKYICFLIGGGKFPDRACLNLLIGRRIARSATGTNDRPGGTERLMWRLWDVSDLAGQTARLQIVDHSIRPWGHITVDHILLTDDKDRFNQSRELTISKRYLNLPVRPGADPRPIRLVVDDKVARACTLALADRDPNDWVALDVAALVGRKVMLQVDSLPRFSHALDLMVQADKPRGRTLDPNE
jgi:fructan beta-fructosidase